MEYFKKISIEEGLTEIDDLCRTKKMFSKDDIGDHSLCNIIYSDYTLK